VFKILIFLFLILIIGCTQQEAADFEVVTKEAPKEPLSETGLGKEAFDQGYSGIVLAGKTTPYLEFNKADYDTAIAENKVILLYFYADWCPICKEEQVSLHDAFNEMDYNNLVGFRVNYRDSGVDEFEQALAREQGITYQHTKVIIKDGQRVLKAPDSWEKERYLEEIKKVI